MHLAWHSLAALRMATHRDIAPYSARDERRTAERKQFHIYPPKSPLGSTPASLYCCVLLIFYLISRIHVSYIIQSCRSSIDLSMMKVEIWRGKNLYHGHNNLENVIQSFGKKSQMTKFYFHSCSHSPFSIYCRLDSRQIRTSSPRCTYRPNFIVSRAQAVETSAAISTYYPLDSRCPINSIYINPRYFLASRSRSVSWKRNSRS